MLALTLLLALPMVAYGQHCPAVTGCPIEQKTCHPVVHNCPPNPLCVEYESSIMDKNGVACPNHCPVSCAPGEIVCHSGHDHLGCPEKNTCIKVGLTCPAITHDSSGCPVPPTCGMEELFCPNAAVEGDPCPVLGMCKPNKSGAIDKFGNKCAANCEIHCGIDTRSCPGGFDMTGCMKPNVCVSHGEACPESAYDAKGCATIAPIVVPTCDGTICSGGYDSEGCPKPDTCQIAAAIIDRPCPKPTHDENGCPLNTCTDQELFCAYAAKEGDTCPPHGYCIPMTSTFGSVTCTNICDPACVENETICWGGMDEQGCNKPGFCIVTGDTCPDMSTPTS